MTTTDDAQHHMQVAAQSLFDASRFMPESQPRASFVAEAQVHATLALAEEQRTANLLAAMKHFELPDDQRLRIAVRLGLA